MATKIARCRMRHNGYVSGPDLTTSIDMDDPEAYKTLDKMVENASRRNGWDPDDVEMEMYDRNGRLFAHHTVNA